MSDTAKHAYSTPWYDMAREEDARRWFNKGGQGGRRFERRGRHAA